jgi:gamma-glutamyltranspeptidase/glutathione hydrolase
MFNKQRDITPAHARTLKRIAETKGAAFYRGELAESMAAHSRKHGGAMTMGDLAAHTADWVEPGLVGL